MRRIEVPDLLTTGRIAALLRVSPERVRRLIRSRAHIRPAAYAAGIPIYDSEAVAAIRHEINAIDARRAGGGR